MTGNAEGTRVTIIEPDRRKRGIGKRRAMICGPSISSRNANPSALEAEPANIAPRRQTAAGREVFLPLPEPFDPFDPLLDLELRELRELLELDPWTSYDPSSSFSAFYLSCLCYFLQTLRRTELAHLADFCGRTYIYQPRSHFPTLKNLHSCFSWLGNHYGLDLPG